VVGTDALAMGLNMPIARIVMTTTVKFNGVEEEEISASLARQIAGRAGRYGVHEEGLVAGFDDDTHEVMRALLRKNSRRSAPPGFSVAPSLEHLHRIASVTRETLAGQAARALSTISMCRMASSSRASPRSSRSARCGSTPCPVVAEKFMLSLVPVSTKVPSLQRAWEQWAHSAGQEARCASWSRTMGSLPVAILIPLTPGIKRPEAGARRARHHAWCRPTARSWPASSRACRSASSCRRFRRTW
jgi:ATP-dependent RNA helicase SUPV3L1/SUV3